MNKKFIDALIRFRYWLAVLSLLLTAALASGMQYLYFEADYKIYFQDDNEQLLIYEQMQDTYTETANIMYLLHPRTGDVFNSQVLSSIYAITEQSWQTPYVTRVDSISNFQNTQADGDDLLVEDLILDADVLNGEQSAEKIAWLKQTALSEKRLLNRSISADGKTAAINVTLHLPPEADPLADQQTQIQQRLIRDQSYAEVVEFARQVKADFSTPDLEIHLLGATMVNNTFSESSKADLQSLVPMMYALILLMIAVFLRSIGSVIGTVLLIGCASLAAMGAAGLLAIALNPVSVTAPMIVLTIAVCDAVHLLSIYHRCLAEKMPPVEAMRESIRSNFQPIVLTSVTTAVGFLTLNFATSPPFGQLGNITAIGVLWAMILSFTLLPAVTVLLVRNSKHTEQGSQRMRALAGFIIHHPKTCFFAPLTFAILLIGLIPLNTIDDDPIKYFKPGIEFRDSADFAIEHLPALNDIEFSLDCGTPGCTSDAEFVAMLADFQQWYERQPAVLYVSTYVDVLRNLNRSMNGDQAAFYTVPDNSALAAQYTLMYEMSLPYGLDLNNQLNLDKSATKVRILAKEISSSEVIALSEAGHQWLKDNYRADAPAASSISLMFAHIGDKNIRAMLFGGLIAILGVTLTILLALRSFKYALISMLPNSIPAFMGFGIWGATVGVVNLAVAMVFSISLGILVDDTVHFISKYRRAREVKKLSPEDSIYYAFENVGSALVVTTLVLSAGFGLLATSDFNVNGNAGMLTMLTIMIALVFDFLILPPILMFFDRKEQSQLSNELG